MPPLTISDNNFKAKQRKHLVLAILEMGIYVGYRYGGYARYPTCRLKFNPGKPLVMTKA